MNWIYENIGTMIIETNEGSGVKGRDEKAKLEYLSAMAFRSGFKNIIKIGHDKGYARPLFIAKR